MKVLLFRLIVVGAAFLHLASCNSDSENEGVMGERIVRDALAEFLEGNAVEAVIALPAETQPISRILTQEGFEQIELSMMSGSGAILENLFKDASAYRMTSTNIQAEGEVYAFVEDDVISLQRVVIK